MKGAKKGDDWIIIWNAIYIFHLDLYWEFNCLKSKGISGSDFVNIKLDISFMSHSISYLCSNLHHIHHLDAIQASYKMWKPLVSCFYPVSLYVWVKTCSVWASLVETSPLEPILSTTSIDSNLIFFTSMSLTHCSLNGENLIPCGFSNFRLLCKAHGLNK